MSEEITIAANAVVAKLHLPSAEIKVAALAALSYAVDGAEHSLTFKRGSWDGRSSFFDFKQGTFPAGFVHYLSARLRQKGHTIRLARHPLPPALGPLSPKVDNFADQERYAFQMECVRRLEKHGQIIVQVATGGGKSRIAKLAVARIGRPAMFLTTRGILMYQMHAAFERDMGIAVSVLGDGQFGHTIVKNGIETQAVKRVSCAMVQTLIARLEEKTVKGELEKMAQRWAKRENKALVQYKKTIDTPGAAPLLVRHKTRLFEAAQVAARPDAATLTREVRAKVAAHMADRAKTIALLGMFELVILEEAHESSGNSYYEILRHCKNAHYRLALTATPFMRDSEESNMRLMACSGPIAMRVTEQTLIDSGILAQPHFKFVRLSERAPKLTKSTGWEAAYRIGIVDNAHRNNHVVAEALRACRHALSVMVLVQQVRHGVILQALLQGAGLRVEYIQGEDDQEGRKGALLRLAGGAIDVLIGTTILDVGVDVPAVGMVILAGGGKAEVALRQRIGRGLREKKTGPNIALIIDFADDFNEHLKNHAAQRRAIIVGTPGFERFVHELGGDFDYPALGLRVQ